MSTLSNEIRVKALESRLLLASRHYQTAMMYADSKSASNRLINRSRALDKLSNALGIVESLPEYPTTAPYVTGSKEARDDFIRRRDALINDINKVLSDDGMWEA